MRLRTPAILTAIVAVIAAFLTASPAQARTYDAYVKTSRIAISSSGSGKVAVQCKGSRQCRGKISFARDTGKPRVRTYRVAAGSTAYVSVALHSDSRDNPNNAPAVAGRDYRSVSKVRLKLDEDAPRNRTRYYDNVTTETRVARRQVTGRVTSLGGPVASDVRVELVKKLRGGNTSVVKGQDVADGGTFALSVSLGVNNSPSNPFLLRVTGRDQDGVKRSWYWRGASGRPTGGGAQVRDATSIRASRGGDFVADVRYASISGSTAGGAEVQVVSPPPSYGGATTQRELDIARCGNFFGATTADPTTGAYTIGFLPATTSTNNRYMIAVRHGATTAWYGSSAQRFGSCYDATSYAKRRANLVTLTGAVTGKVLDASPTGNTVTVKAKYSSAYKPTAQGDRWIRLREKVPGVRILDAPVVAEGQGDASGRRTFTDLPAGQYWVEVGRRTGCADWYPSRFTNNAKYFKGLDRKAEGWKSFRTLRQLQGSPSKGLERVARTVQPNPARGTVQNTVPRGYAGWMYRNYCKARGAGTINTLTVSGTGTTQSKGTSRNPQGALVKGKVTRVDGRTNKEMLVRLTSSKGTRIVRTGITDSSGTFYIAGLASGTWTVSVNSDSWRGIGRTFSGRKSITVKAGKGYNIGTLNFKS